MVGDVELRLFGPLTLRCGERVLSGRAFGGRKPRQLLAVLALAGGRLVANERLFDALWGDELPANPSATLEHYVCVLRNRLAGVAGPSGRSLVETGPSSYRLATERLRVDLVEVDRLLRQVAAGSPGSSPLLHRALALAERPLLEDELVLEWAEHERHRLAARLAHVLGDAPEHVHHTAARYEAAVQAAS